MLPKPDSDAAKNAFAAACRETDRLSHDAVRGYPELSWPDGMSFWGKDTLTRALEQGEVEPVEYARLYPLAAEREHRIEAAAIATNLGALFALAHAADYPHAGDDDTENGAPDPIPAAIAASRAAEAEMKAFGKRPDTKKMTRALFREEDRLCEIQSCSRDVALSTVPTTHAGRVALAEYVRFVMDLYGMGEDGEGSDNRHLWKQTHATLIEALVAPAVQPVAADFDLVLAAGKYASTLDLSGVSFGNLILLQEQFGASSNALLAISNDESLWDDEVCGHTAGGNLLEAERNRLGCLRDTVVDELDRHKTTTTDERNQRLEALVMQELRCEGRIRSDALLAEINVAWGA